MIFSALAINSCWRQDGIAQIFRCQRFYTVSLSVLNSLSSFLISSTIRPTMTPLISNFKLQTSNWTISNNKSPHQTGSSFFEQFWFSVFSSVPSPGGRRTDFKWNFFFELIDFRIFELFEIWTEKSVRPNHARTRDTCHAFQSSECLWMLYISSFGLGVYDWNCVDIFFHLDNDYFRAFKQKKERRI
jgi:hypothetical protein